MPYLSRFTGMPATEPERDAHRRGGRGLLYASVGLTTYVLSVGPAFALAVDEKLPRSIARTIYAPLIWAGHCFPSINHVLSEYIFWWYRHWPT